MKKILTALVVLLTAFSMSASAVLMPDWMEDLQSGDRQTQASYNVVKGFAEDDFTPTTLSSSLFFGEWDGTDDLGRNSMFLLPDSGGFIEQTLSTSIGGDQIASVDSTWDRVQPLPLLRYPNVSGTPRIQTPARVPR
jgi:hypothetical protein